MEVFSVINLTQSRYYRGSSEYLAQQLSFSEKLTFHPSTFEETIHPSYLGCTDLVKCRKIMYQSTLPEVKAIYTDAFDFNKTPPPYVTYNKFDTQRERDRVLAKPKVLYEIFGLRMVDNELSGYLPLMLRSLHIAGRHNDPHAEGNTELVTMITEGGAYKTANQLIKENNPYAYVIRALQGTLKAYLDIPEEVTHRA